MLTRRQFAGSLTAAALCTADILAQSPSANPPASATSPGPVTFSVMMWTLKSLGTFEQNIEKVASAGYQHVELVGENSQWSEADAHRIAARIQTLGLTVDAMTGVKPGFAETQSPDTFTEAVRNIVPIAQRLGNPQIILVSGKRFGDDPARQHSLAIENLKRAADILAPAGLTAVIEPIDRLENPPIYLDSVVEAGLIARAVNSPSIKVLYDLYHEQRTQGDLIEKLEANIAQIGLIHIADVPGRHQPGTGEVNYSNIYRKLAQLHYKGVIAMEFYPTGDAVEVLRRAREEAEHAMA